MSLEGIIEVGWKLRDLRGGPVFQESTFLEYSRSSPGALVRSDLAAGSSTSDDEFLNNGTELEGDVSPEALTLMPLLLVSICHESTEAVKSNELCQCTNFTVGE
jgi:hypothetical protein